MNRAAAVVFHQSANAAFEHGATSRFSAASARYASRGQRLPGRAGTGRLVDDPRHAEIFQHAPGRGDRAEVLVPGPVRQAQPAAAHRGGQLLGGAQVLL